MASATRSLCVQIEATLGEFPIFPGENSSSGPIAELIAGLRDGVRFLRSMEERAAAQQLRAGIDPLRESVYDLNVFVPKNISPSLRLEVKAGLLRIDGVRSAVYWTSEELLEHASAVLGNDPLLNPGTTSSMFKATLLGTTDLDTAMEQVGSLPRMVDYAVVASDSLTDALRPLLGACRSGVLSAVLS